MKTPEIKPEDISKTIKDVLNGKPMYEVAGWSDQQIKSLHRKAHEQYTASDYTAALKSFKTLLLLNATDSRVWMGYAGTAMMLHQYEDAIKAYGYAALFDPRRPEPFFYAMECHLALKNIDAAKVSATHVTELSNGKPEFASFAEKAAITLTMISETHSH